MKKKGIRVYGIGYKEILFLIPLCLYTFFPLFAQQIGMVSHYFYKPMVYNPAFTGDGDAAYILLIHHTQWADFKGAPQLNIFTLDGHIMKKKVGLGMEIISDKKGINNNTGGNLFYSYRMNFNDNMHLSLGMSFGIINQSLDYSKALVENTADPTLFPDLQHKTTYDGNAGLAFVSKGLEFGLAAPHLFGNKITYSDNASSHAYYAQSRHYMSSLKYKIFLSKEKGISIAPQVLLRFVPNAPLQYDGNVIFNLNDKFWIGATYKSNYAVAANVGFCVFKHFTVGYSYDIITGGIGNNAGLSHEIMLNLNFGKNKKYEVKPVADESPKSARKDSLGTAKTPEPKPVAQPKVENKTPAAKDQPKFDYEAYRKHKLDSIENAKLKEKQDKKKPNKNSEAIQNNPNKTMYNDRVWIATNKLLEFKDANNQSQTGFYVVVGSFYNRGYAKNFVQHLITDEGFKSANWMYAEATRFNYVYVIRVNTKEEAFKHANNAKVAGYEDVWIQQIVEQ